MKAVSVASGPSTRRISPWPCRRLTLVLLVLSMWLTGNAAALRAAEKVTIDFARQIQPILANNCFACHGPDEGERQGELRLDLREWATRGGESGTPAIVPGKSTESELVARVSSTDDSLRMPPPESKKHLTAAELELLTRWVDEGAVYQSHWAFRRPLRVAAPPVKQRDWPRNDVDRFLLAKLEAHGLSPSREADRATLIRRLSLDLRGLPPSLAEVEAFLADNNPRAYENLVEQFLASPHYGEKMALIWLDLARFGDTNGFHIDSTREMSPYRDWVIDAYNANMPFDRFTIEQLAGDLLPNATVDQLVASSFNRNTRFNEEGGADPQEFLVRYAVERTSTLGAAWLGMTLECAECHSHKYDPISHKEFYSLYAFFNSLDEEGAGGVSGFHNKPVPHVVKVLDRSQRDAIATAERRSDELRQKINEAVRDVDYTDPGPEAEPPVERTEHVWVDDALPAGAAPLGSEAHASWQFVEKPAPVFSGAKSHRRTGKGITQHYFQQATAPLKVGEGDTFFAHVFIDEANPPKMVMLQLFDGAWEHRAYWGDDHVPWGVAGTPSRHPAGPLPAAGKWVRLEVAASAVGLRPGAVVTGMAFTQFDGAVHWDAAGIVSSNTPGLRAFRSLAAWERHVRETGMAELPPAVKDALSQNSDQRSAEQQSTIRRYFLTYIYTELRETLSAEREELSKLDEQIRTLSGQGHMVMVSKELAEPRPARILLRGDFQRLGEQVQRDVPAIFPPLPDDPAPSRETLARWLVDPQHPLTARVAVNRLWKQTFGAGLVRSMGDFGLQGDLPSHPELLDWLAVELVESGWDVKHLLRTLVLSQAYRQSAVATRDGAEIDPQNRLLSHAARFRLTGEELRDNALAISGLLSPKIGGPSVFPYQPADYYSGKFNWKWTQSTGDDLYRRGIYTFVRRTTPYPAFVIFDGSSRENCVVDRPRTNTPLQALTLLNDPTFTEAARAFAQRILLHEAATPDERIDFAVRSALARPPADRERALLAALLREQLELYRADASAAAALASVGQCPRPEGLDTAELAAWTAVANVLLNLDETITRE